MRTIKTIPKASGWYWVTHIGAWEMAYLDHPAPEISHHPFITVFHGNPPTKAGVFLYRGRDNIWWDVSTRDTEVIGPDVWTGPIAPPPTEPQELCDGSDSKNQE